MPPTELRLIWSVRRSSVVSTCSVMWLLSRSVRGCPARFNGRTSAVIPVASARSAGPGAGHPLGELGQRPPPARRTRAPRPPGRPWSTPTRRRAPASPASRPAPGRPGRCTGRSASSAHLGHAVRHLAGAAGEVEGALAGHHQVGRARARSARRTASADQVDAGRRASRRAAAARTRARRRPRRPARASVRRSVGPAKLLEDAVDAGAAAPRRSPSAARRSWSRRTAR